MLKKSNYKKGYVSLERAISKMGLGSRTQARQWIMAGKIKVNGVIKRRSNFAVSPERAKIEMDGEIVSPAQNKTFLLYKPRGIITTKSDELGRKTVFSLISEPLHLIAVGRLDLATSGLLILTNNTKFADWLTDPKNKVPRIYLVTIRGKFTENKKEKLITGVTDNNEVLTADKIILNKISGKESHLTVELNEGKNREIRRMFLTLGHEVTRLKRVAFGGLTLGALQPGGYRELSITELRKSFRYTGFSSYQKGAIYRCKKDGSLDHV